ncbi:MAG: ADP-ribosylglycohydrolase family protein [Cyanobacteria bacterium P01_F01_bin.4]
MIGAIIGDAVGSAYEFERIKTKDFQLITSDSIWTDDTVLTLATADCLLYGSGYAEAYKRWFHWYPVVKGGYGRSFTEWAKSKVSRPYYSCNNISAIRVVPVAYAFDNLKDVLKEAERSAEVTFMVWSEVDQERAIWADPGARMKISRQRREPL